MDSFLLRICKLSLSKQCAFHTSTHFNSNRQTTNAMKKILGLKKKRKMHYEDGPILPRPDVFSKGAYEGKKSGNSRRSHVLNKLFMTHITDLMATGEHSSEILGYGIEVNKVQVAPDYKTLKVFWIAKGTPKDDVIDNILQKNAGFLRHELSELRVMGVVPRILFVKDKDYAKIVEVDNRLAIADFGEDHEPPNKGEKLMRELQIVSKLDDNLKEKLKSLEELDESRSEEIEEPLPSMPQNVFNLNHDIIMEKVRKSLKKSEALHRESSSGGNNQEWVKFKINQPTNEQPVSFGSGKSERAVFKEFLHKRQLLRDKASNEWKNKSDLELFLREELVEERRIDYEKFGLKENYDDDFIVEDYDEEKYLK